MTRSDQGAEAGAAVRPAAAACFGKLPVAGDFVRGDRNLLGVIDRWIQAGLHTASLARGASWNEAFDTSPPARFVWRGDGPGGDIAGCWWASRDAAGRRYPFLIAAGLPPLRGEAFPRVIPAMQHFFEDSEALFGRGFDGLNAAGCAARVGELQYRYEPALGEEGCRSIWASTRADVGSAGVLADCADALSGSTPSYCLRWPTEPGSGDATVAFWLELFDRLQLQRPRLVMWSRDPGSGGQSVRMAWGAPSPRSFAGMMQPALEDDAAFDAGRRRSESADDLRRVFTPERSLVDVLAEVTALDRFGRR